jgi:formiminotetrahydrofolate cyclodeaminase
MAASLLAMVCGITARSKKHETAKPLLLRHREALRTLGEDLVRLAAEDAGAYDSVVESMRDRKARPGPAADEAVQKSLKRAAEVPMSTATKCLKVLETSAIVAKLGAKSASSDVGVGVLLAEAGFKGAVMNVRINLKDISDKAFSASAEAMMKDQEGSAREAASRALALLGEE